MNNSGNVASNMNRSNEANIQNV